ncbi:hypothetical protein M422DRAFT_167577, partial [Sphaerobolus stellatus SS14]
DFFASAMDDLQEAPTVTTARDLGLPHVQALMPGLEVRFMPHQLIGVAWMVNQEKKNIKGGILADDMGLGKTLQAIALCVKNRPPPNADKKSTLVVAPAALLQQWKTEIEQRTSSDLGLKVRIHHGNFKLNSVNEVKEFDIVIMTYHTLLQDFPKAKKKEDQGDMAQDEAWGPLAKTKWYRIVLDEAQIIRNRATRASKCAARLDATYRWALTGTPVTNTLADLYGIVRFLRLRPFNDWKEFNHRIVRYLLRNPLRTEMLTPGIARRAQAMLKLCLLRRTKHYMLEGKPILQLPPKIVEVIELEFSQEEREIYSKIEARQQQKMSKYLKAGTVMKKYVMLLRLRQACNHPKLITRVVTDDEDGLPRVDTSPEGERKRAEQLLGAQWMQDAYRTEVKLLRFLEHAQSRIKEDAEEEDTDCSICFDTFVNNCRITSCKHLFCGDCLNDLFKNPPTEYADCPLTNFLREEDANYNKTIQTGRRSCPVCRGDIYPNKVFKTSAFEPSDEELNIARSSPIANDSYDPKGKGKAVMRHESDVEEILEDMNIDEDLVLSAKMARMAELIKQSWQQGNDRLSISTDGMIIKSNLRREWNDRLHWLDELTRLYTVIEKALKKDNIQSVRFDGKMTRIARDEAVTQFKKHDGPPIILISLKCGGVGLNLVEANRVLSLDLVWNAATENQAFDRVHRMGQQKDVHVKRLIIRNTVEERILNLQLKKQSLADAVLGEGTG